MVRLRRSARGRGRSRRRYGGRCTIATGPAVSLAAHAASAGVITSGTGRMAAPPCCRTSHCCVAGITARFTKPDIRWSDSLTGNCASGDRMVDHCPTCRRPPSFPPTPSARCAHGVTLVLLLLAVVVPPAPAPAADDVKIALVAPLSGRWARQGQLKKMGAEMAIEEINAQGGIKALGGAKLVLREADAGDSVEKAVSAPQRGLTRDKITAGIGS